MPNIKSSTDLRNNYNDISTFCHTSREPVFITKNGRGDLEVMSLETYEVLSGKLELYRLLDEGHTATIEGRKRPLDDVMSDIKSEINDDGIFIIISPHQNQQKTICVILPGISQCRCLLQ